MIRNDAASSLTTMPPWYHGAIRAEVELLGRRWLVDANSTRPQESDSPGLSS